MNIPMQVLIVEDDDSWAQELGQRLDEEGMTTHWARTLAEAERCCRSIRPDFVLLDIALGRENGLDLINRVRDAGIASISFIVVTGRSEWELASIATDRGVDGYLFKPIDPDHLIDKLQSKLSFFIARSPAQI
jgi:DNA-binding response OmpR family regulator